MIHYLTGTLGAGKSMYAARVAARALLSGRVVASNMRLVDGWEHQLMNRTTWYKYALRDRAARQELYRADVARRYAYVPEIWNLLGARLHGRGEGRGVMIIDEAHNEINNREWQEQNQKDALRKLTLARKRGWTVYIISQHKGNTDAALRRIATTEISCVNWRQLTRMPLVGTHLLPFHFFLARTYILEHTGQQPSRGRKLASEVYFRGWFASLYDTFEDFDGGLGDDPDAMWLPRPVGGEASAAVAALASAPAEGLASDSPGNIRILSAEGPPQRETATGSLPMAASNLDDRTGSGRGLPRQ